MSFPSPAFLIAILIALSVHEWAHAFAADKLGDPTARNEGRLTLNPLAHLDPLGTLMFFIVHFGWGKPVPVDPRYFKHPKRDMAIVAAAGPISNIVLALISVIVLALFNAPIPESIFGLIGTEVSGSPFIAIIVQLCYESLFINLALMAFNLLPIAPLDGSKIVRIWIPARYDYEYDLFMTKGPFILLALLLVDNLLPLPILSGWVFGIMTPFYIALHYIGGML